MQPLRSLVSWLTRRGPSLGLSLGGLVLVAVVPLLVFGAGAAWIVVDLKTAAVESELTSTARALQVALDRELLNQFDAMRVLSTDGSLDTGAFADFHDRAERVLLVNKQWRNIGLVDPQTHAIVAGALPMPTAPIITSSPAAVDEVVRTRMDKVVGLLPTGKIVREPIIQFMVPVVRDDAVRYVLVVALDPKPLSALFAAQRLAPTWTGAIMDQNMLIAGRSRDPQKYVGLPATTSLANRVRASHGGMFIALNQEGDTVYTVFSRSASTGWSVAIGIPAAEVEGPIQRTLWQLSLAGAALMAFALGLTALVGRAIARGRRVYESALRDSRSQLQFALTEFQELVERVPVGIYRYRITPDGGRHFEFANERLCTQIGVTQEQIQHDPGSAFRGIVPQDLPAFVSLNEAARQSLTPFRWEGRMLGPAGLRWMRIESTATALPNGDVLWNGMLYDITERRQSEEALRKLSIAVEQSPASVVITDLNAIIEYVNPRFTDVSGYSAAEVIGKNPNFVQSGMTPRDTYVNLWEQLTHGRSWHGELINRRKNGEIYWEDSQIAPVTDADGKITHYVAIKADVTERVRAETSLMQSEAKIKSVLEGAADAIFITDPSGHCQYVNAQATQVLGYGSAELMTMGIADIVAGDDVPEFLRQFNLLLTTGALRCEIRLRRKDGTTVPVDFNGTVLPDGSAFGACRDISERKQMEDKVRQLAFHDVLTGLPNRRLLLDRLRQAMAASRRSGRYAAVAFLDLDNFKPLNDVHGHDMGDLLLIEVAERIKRCVREIDTVARFGGDEFVIVLSDLNADEQESHAQALAIAEKIRTTISEVFTLPDGREGPSAATVTHHCTASIGVAVFTNHEASEQNILKWADAAMYQAKEAGRNVVRFHGAIRPS